MPRRRPTQLPRPATYRRPGRRVRQVSHVSVGTLRAIAEFETNRLYPGAIAEALDRWARHVRGPARRFYDDPAPCSCSGCDGDHLTWGRAELGAAMRGLPTKAARELRARVQPLDEVYLARTVLAEETVHIRARLGE
ncbi:hypothetical protein GCM10029964_026900 [Kibdelosporangium lantanae]